MPRKMRVARAEEFWVEALVADSQRVKARVRAVEKLGGQVVIGLDVKDWVGARSGQFAMLQPVRSRCFLPRAFSVFTGARGGSDRDSKFSHCSCGTRDGRTGGDEGCLLYTSPSHRD